MRNAFAAEITSLAGEDGRIVLLSGDIGNRLFNDYKARYAERFYNCGVAEANMTGMAAGLALCGLRPVTYTITPFATTRCMEQIRLDVCYHNLPVVIVGTGSGLSYASLGATHHSLEDISFLRALPNMTVICPADTVEVKLALRAALRYDGPVYIRLGKKGEPLVHQSEPAFAIGRGMLLREGKDICLLSTGNMLPVVLQTAEFLAEKGIQARVVNLHTVKPLDDGLLEETFQQYPLVATVEEHSLIGGLGSALAEWAADQAWRGGRLLRFGSADKFIHEAGSQASIRAKQGLTPDQMADRIAEAYASCGGRL